MRRTRGIKKSGVYAEDSSSDEEIKPKRKSACLESSDSNQTPTASDSKKRTCLESSDDESPKSPEKKKVARIQPSDDEINANSSSSESDIESYLKRPDELNLNSTFFKTVQPKVPFSQIEKNIFEDIKQLSDSESDGEVEVRDEPQKVAIVEKPTYEAPKATFEQLSEFTKKIEEAKMHIEKYQAKKKVREKKEDISKLLTAGEKNAWNSPEMLKSVNSALAETSLRSSDFESLSESEKEDWEEVEQTEQSTKPELIPKGGVEITVRMPEVIRKNKSVDLLAAMKRRLNKIKKENQVYIHRVHLLTWIAHGNYVNDILNKDTVLALALSLIPSQQCYPSDRIDLKYLEQILSWYRRTITNVEKITPKNIPLDKNLIMQINKKQAHNTKMYVYIFVCILRALGIQCRLVLSLQVEPLRPPASELHSLSQKEDADKKAGASGIQKGKDSVKKVSSKPKQIATTNEPTTKLINTKSSNKRKSKDAVEEKSESRSKKEEYNDNLEEEIIQKQKPERKRKSDGVKVDGQNTKVIKKTASNKLSNNKDEECSGELRHPDEVKSNKRTKYSKKDKNDVSSKKSNVKNKTSEGEANDFEIDINDNDKDNKPVKQKLSEVLENETKTKCGRKKIVEKDEDISNNETLKITDGKLKQGNNRNKDNQLSNNKKSSASSKKNSTAPKKNKVNKASENISNSKNDDNQSKEASNGANNESSNKSSISMSPTYKNDAEQETSNDNKDVIVSKESNIVKTEICSPTKIIDTAEPLNAKLSTSDNQQEALEVPKKTRRSRKSVSKVEKNLDNYIASLESLEKLEVKKEKPGEDAGHDKKSPTSSKATLQIPNICDDFEMDRDKWRRSKSHSPYGSKPKIEVAPTLEKSTSSCLLDESADAIESKNKEVKKGRGKRKTNGLFRMPMKLKTKSREIPQIDGNFDFSDDSSDYSMCEVPQIDGNDDGPSSSRKPSLNKLKEPKSPLKRHPARLKIQPIYKEIDSEDDFRPRSPFTSKNHNYSKVNLSKLKDTEKRSPILDKTSPKVNLEKLNQSPKSMKPLDVRNDIVSLIKGRINEQKHKDSAKLVKPKGKPQVNNDSDSDYAPMPVIKKKQSPDNKLIQKVKVKRRVQPKKELDRKVFSSDDEGGADATKKKKGLDIWIEVYLENEEKWISADVVKGQVHCVKEIYSRASHPVSYILAWDNTNRVKDITKRYCLNWNTVTRKLRTDQKWWEQSLAPFIGKKNARDKEEDEDLARQQLDQPLPKVISEYKDHPLYVLQRHLLKFQAIYPPDAITLGFVRNEPVYSRDCVYTLHSREIWLKHAKVVKLGEKPYKIVKARPKYDKLSNTVIKDQLLEIFGEWQIEDYVPPTAENGIVPRNAYGNVELFKECMLPKGTVHLQLPGLNKVAKKLNVDCAPAVIGFDFHSGWSHPTFDGFIVCEEFADKLVAAWYQEQEDMEKREQEKYEKRVYGNWRRLIKGLFIRERLKARYDFGGELTVPIPKPPEKPEKKPKGPRFLINKKKK